MRIGYDAKRAFYNRSGLGNYSRDLIRLLLQFYPENEYFLYTPKIRNSIYFAEQEKGKVISPEKAKTGLSRSYWRTFQLRHQIEKDKIDLYHGLSNELPKDIHKSRIRSIVTIHDLIFLRHPQWYPAIDRFIYKKKFSYSCQIADTIIAISQQTRNDLLEYFQIDERKVEVIYQGCNHVFKHFLADDEKKKIKEKWKLPDEYILYVGTIEERKNLLSVIKSLHLGKITIPLVVVGKQTKYYKKVKEYIDKHAVKHIYFLREVSVLELPGIYQMASLFIYPSVFEGFGIPILEALYSRIPVITSKGGCFKEAGGESSIYINPMDVEEMIHAIQSILKDEELRKDMVDRGYEHAQQFSDEQIARKVVLLYDRLCNE